MPPNVPEGRFRDHAANERTLLASEPPLGPKRRGNEGAGSLDAP